VFDAEAPFTPRGCIAQAWSVAELLRVSVKLDMVRLKPDATPGNSVRTTCASSAS
jgi:glycogen debranching enzyme